jgi:hypothetical protein
MAVNRPLLLRRRKDPDEVLLYSLSWADEMASLQENIMASTWFIASGTGLTIGPNPSTFTGTATKVWLSGGVLGTKYTITNRVNVSNGETLDQSVILRMASR